MNVKVLHVNPYYIEARTYFDAIIMPLHKRIQLQITLEVFEVSGQDTSHVSIINLAKIYRP